MRHVNIPIFIPHLGCPNQCVFCNQRTISGVEKFNPENVREQIDLALETIEDDAEVEIAFFGGSFTGIDRELMVELLDIGYSYIQADRVKSLRCSTRPDYIDEEIIGILKNYGVKTVELGLQSSCNSVLEKSKRGHYFEAEEESCRLIVESGLELVGQMMIGLPGSDLDSELETARFIINAGARGARIYPTVVFRETELCQMTHDGEYTPLSLEDAISRSSKVLSLFVDAGVEVIRIGLQASEGLESKDSYVAGPNHPALGELIIGEYYYEKILNILSSANYAFDEHITVLVKPGSLSKAIGQNAKNKTRLKAVYKNIRFAESDGLKEYEVSVITRNGEIKCI
ncbi:MAG: radical SAM protein [Clostridia bacterium]|nr:radical SAM protein [Clostridia bacterium]